MDHDDDIKARTEGRGAGSENRPQLPLQPVAVHRALKPAARPEAYAGSRRLSRQDPNGQRDPPGPPSPSIDSAKDLVLLQGEKALENRVVPLRGDKLPAALSSTTIQGALSALGLHALEKPVDLFPLAVGFVGEVLLHFPHYTNGASENQGESA